MISYIRRVVAQRVGHGAADEPDDRRRGGHREAADARGLGDRRVADVGVGVVGPVARRGTGPRRCCAGPVNHSSPVPDDLDAEVGAVAGHRRRPPSSRGCRAAASVASLQAGITRLRKKWSLPPTNRSHLGDVGRRRVGRRSATGSSSRSSISVPARLRLWPSSPICSIWAMIAVMSIGPAARTARLQRRAEHVGHPAQPVDHLGAVGAVAQHLAEALVERAERPCRRAPSSRSSNIHIDGEIDAGHRADGAAVVARVERDRRRRRELALGLLGVVGQPLEQHRADQRAAQRARTRGPSRSAARRAGTCPRSRPSTSDAGRTSTSVGAGREHPRDRACALAAARRGSAMTAGQVGLGAGHRRAPVDLGDLDGLVAQRVGEEVDAGGDDRRLGGAARAEAGGVVMAAS